MDGRWRLSYGSLRPALSQFGLLIDRVTRVILLIRVNSALGGQVIWHWPTLKSFHHPAASDSEFDVQVV
jgi:hypothetical protein